MADDPIEQRLRRGFQRFHREVFSPHRAAYQQAAVNDQRPHTLVICCADSRVDPEALTQSGPGSIFVKRNIGNMVPLLETMDGVHAAIEYAVEVLRAQHILVCGHTDCGAMTSLLRGPTGLPAVDRWLENGRESLERARSTAGGTPTLAALTQQNVLVQLERLRAAPAVQRGLLEQRLTIGGWIYDIYSGDVRAWEEATGEFASLLESARQK